LLGVTAEVLAQKTVAAAMSVETAVNLLGFTMDILTGQNSPGGILAVHSLDFADYRI
jgi:hypothetical protein